MKRYVFKILIAGSGGIGKTAFLKRFEENVFTEDYKMTIGFALDIIHYTLELEGQESVLITAHIIDCGGEERFRHVVENLAQGCSGAFLAVDLTDYETFQSVPEWLKIIRKNAGFIPIWLIGNKCDISEDKYEIEDEVAKDYAERAKMAGWIMTSAKENIRIKEAWRSLFKSLIEEKEDTPLLIEIDNPTDTKEQFKIKLMDICQDKQIVSFLTNVFNAFLEYKPSEAEKMFTLAQVGEDRILNASELLHFIEQIKHEKKFAELYNVGDYLQALVQIQISIRMKDKKEIMASNLIECAKHLKLAGYEKHSAITFVYATCQLLTSNRELLNRKLDEDDFYIDLIAVDRDLMAFPLYLVDATEITNEDPNPLIGLLDNAKKFGEYYGIDLGKSIIKAINWVEDNLIKPKITEISVEPHRPSSGDDVKLFVDIVNPTAKKTIIELHLRAPFFSFPETHVKEIIEPHTSKKIEIYLGIVNTKRRSVIISISLNDENGVRLSTTSYDIGIKPLDEKVEISEILIQPKKLRLDNDAEVVLTLKKNQENPLDLIIRLDPTGMGLPSDEKKLSIKESMEKITMSIKKAQELGMQRVHAMVLDKEGKLLTDETAYFKITRSLKNIMGKILKIGFDKI